MKTPTIEEVIEHFKDAEEVICNEYGEEKREVFKIDLNSAYNIGTQIVCNAIEKNTPYVSLYFRGEYAKITKYKNQKYDLSKLTPEIVQELIKEPNIHEMFVRIGVVKIEETYIKIPLSEIKATPNDCDLGKLVRQIAG